VVLVRTDLKRNTKIESVVDVVNMITSKELRNDARSSYRNENDVNIAALALAWWW